MGNKNSHTGPIWVVTKQNLLDMLPQEVAAYTRQAIQEQPVIDGVVDTWGKIYHTLVWLAAAKDAPGPNELIELDTNGDPVILQNSHIVPAFTAGEAGSNTAELAGLIFGIQNIFDQDKDNEDGGILFQDEAYQKYIVNGVTQPLLQHFFLKFETLRNASGFDPQAFNPAATLDQCRSSTSAMGFHDDTDEFVQKALDLIWDLWDASIFADLNKINGWLNDAGGSPAAGSEQWLNEKFQIDTLNIAELFAGSDSVAKKKLNTATLAFSLDREIFGFIYDRFVDLDDGTLKSDGLEQVIAILTSPLDNSTAWDHLVTATYGAVAMKIFKQTEELITFIYNRLLGGIR